MPLLTNQASESGGIILADQERSQQEQDLRHSEELGENNEYGSRNYTEETAAEIAAPVSLGRNSSGEDYRGEENAGMDLSGGMMGYGALALSILSLFVLPILFGAAGIILGFIARRRGARTTGAWAIGIGAVSIIIGIFILPFF
ncbi:hypothetical protein B14911_07750 [Bacillus sp. NRRL B-14911]|uniref:DUF4190 domain-containing protein n=1 Tax=Bacillus infantis NRRL B-14911 TaxID=1367477 RepID=U5LDJ4_9BACI|nr:MULTISPECIES: DUF308 domain-containing protein [Bacillus]AGX05535.1 hypothetical protein N288_18265 [Bacillus infantis NRRL B-14911]EAR65128.1 hypothetical protein B14911_07750 [Bacillus sp. NRRL B-14911]